MEQMQEFETEARNDLIEGRNAVMEALRAGRTIDKIFIAKGDVDKTLGHIASKARSAGIVVTEADRRKLDAMSQTHAHQGVIALCAVKEYSTIEDMLAIAAERGEAPFLVLCDEISDPHNLGAIIRTAECVGAHGVIIPKRRSAGLTAVVDKASAGALEHMAVARVPNLVAAIETLKKNGLWIYGTAAEGSNELWKTDLTGPACIVIGSEGAGISRLVREKCDFLVSIPLRGQISSLNASAAAAVLLSEALRQRSGTPAPLRYKKELTIWTNLIARQRTFLSIWTPKNSPWNPFWTNIRIFRRMPLHPVRSRPIAAGPSRRK